jgi:hypothetical protein
MPGMCKKRESRFERRGARDTFMLIKEASESSVFTKKPKGQRILRNSLKQKARFPVRNSRSQLEFILVVHRRLSLLILFAIILGKSQCLTSSSIHQNVFSVTVLFAHRLTQPLLITSSVESSLQTREQIRFIHGHEELPAAEFAAQSGYITTASLCAPSPRLKVK